MSQKVYVVHVESVGEANFGGPEIYCSDVVGVYTRKEVAEEVARLYRTRNDSGYDDNAYVTGMEVV